MSMEDQGEQFEQLRRLMKLKNHEVPPPGYFNRFPGTVISEIRRDQHARGDVVDRLEVEAPWLVRLWRTLAAKPVFAGGLGAALCSLVIGGIVLAEKPVNRPDLARQGQKPAFLTESAPLAGSTLEGALLLTATNLNSSAPESLFDQVPVLQVAPVSVYPGN